MKPLFRKGKRYLLQIPLLQHVSSLKLLLACEWIIVINTLQLRLKTNSRVEFLQSHIYT